LDEITTQLPKNDDLKSISCGSNQHIDRINGITAPRLSHKNIIDIWHNITTLPPPLLMSEK